MAIKINLEKHIREGWTVQAFIDDLQPIADMIYNGRSCNKKFETIQDIKKWCMSNQPYYKKYIPDVVTYFCQRYNVTS